LTQDKNDFDSVDGFANVKTFGVRGCHGTKSKGSTRGNLRVNERNQLFRMPDFVKMALPFFGIFLMYKLDFTDPANIFIVRMSFAVVQAITIAVCVIIYFKISSSSTNKDSTDEKILVKRTPELLSGESSETKPISMTRTEYDMEEWQKFVKQTLITTAMIVGIHYYFEVIPPLLMQSIMGVSTLIGMPLVNAYIFNRPISRPFQEEESLMTLFNKLTQQQPDEDNTNETASSSSPTTTPTIISRSHSENDDDYDDEQEESKLADKQQKPPTDNKKQKKKKKNIKSE